MRNRLTSLLMLVTMIHLCALASPGVVLAQSVELGSTPEAVSSPSTERGAAADVPTFGMVAVGNHPTGFFDDIEVDSGESVELTVSIVNSGEGPVSLYTYKVNALSAVNGGFLAGLEDDSPMGATAWIDYPSTDLQLEPGAQQEITFTVTVPEDTPPGQYISGLFARMTDETPVPGAANLTQTRGYVISVGIIVPGELAPAFSVGEPSVEQTMLTVPVTNTGNYLVRPAGELSLTNGEGEVVHTSTIQMGSVYAGLETAVQVALPAQMAPGDYTLNLTLIDEASGVPASLEDATVTVPDPDDATGLAATVDIEPNADPIAYADVTATLANGGVEIPAANVVLTVSHDGSVVEEFSIESNIRLSSGETEVTARYIPAGDWEPGTYTFELEVSAVNRQGGDETVLLTEVVDDSIAVP